MSHYDPLSPVTDFVLSTKANYKHLKKNLKKSGIDKSEWSTYQIEYLDLALAELTYLETLNPDYDEVNFRKELEEKRTKLTTDRLWSTVPGQRPSDFINDYFLKKREIMHLGIHEQIAIRKAYLDYMGLFVQSEINNSHIKAAHGQASLVDLKKQLEAAKDNPEEVQRVVLDRIEQDTSNEERALLERKLKDVNLAKNDLMTALSIAYKDSKATPKKGSSINHPFVHEPGISLANYPGHEPIADSSQVDPMLSERKVKEVAERNRADARQLLEKGSVHFNNLDEFPERRAMLAFVTNDSDSPEHEQPKSSSEAKEMETFKILYWLLKNSKTDRPMSRRVESLDEFVTSCIAQCPIQYTTFRASLLNLQEQLRNNSLLPKDVPAGVYFGEMSDDESIELQVEGEDPQSIAFEEFKRDLKRRLSIIKNVTQFWDKPINVFYRRKKSILEVALLTYLRGVEEGILPVDEQYKEKLIHRANKAGEKYDKHMKDPEVGNQKGGPTAEDISLAISRAANRDDEEDLKTIAWEAKTRQMYTGLKMSLQASGKDKANRRRCQRLLLETQLAEHRYWRDRNGHPDDPSYEGYVLGKIAALDNKLVGYSAPTHTSVSRFKAEYATLCRSISDRTQMEQIGIRSKYINAAIKIVQLSKMAGPFWSPDDAQFGYLKLVGDESSEIDNELLSAQQDLLQEIYSTIVSVHEEQQQATRTETY